MTVGCVSSAAQNPSSNSQATHWRLVEGWPQLPADFRLGQVSGVSLDSKGHVFVFVRAGRTFDMTATEPVRAPTVLELEPGSGRLINSWGSGLFLVPHSVTIDAGDNVWLGDVGRHQILKFTHDGRLLLAVGERRVPGWDGTHFNEPADVAVVKDGSFYVADGYQNSRVAHFAADGKFLNEWGAKGNAPGQFVIPHGIARDARGRVYVADRQNSRLQVFDSTGKFLKAWPPVPRVGRIFDVAISPSGRVYLASTDGSDAVVVLDAELNQVGRIPSDSTRLKTAHQIAVQGDTVIYLADTGGLHILKFVRQ